ncbi:MAG: IS110 family transposase [Gemmatimonadales bacterium]|nr:MAG: IS110 family transposase [Gemmatimonadales bacterium]
MTNANNRTAPAWAGIDVAKETFEAALHPAWVPGEELALSDLPRANFPRTADGVASFLGWLDGAKATDGIRAVMETTGRYSVELAELLLAARSSLVPAIVDAKSASHFGRSLRLRNKTDRVDAGMLARFGAERCPPPWRPLAPEYAELREMSRQRTFLVESLVTARNRLAEIESVRSVARVQKQVIASLEKAIERIEELMHKHVAKHASLARAVRRLDTTPGVAFVTATTVLGELGDLARFLSSRSLSAFAGVSPRLFDSGATVHGRPRMCKQGSPRVRQVLYLASLAAVRNPRNRFGRSYAAMVDAGKPRMVALGAIMRKMLVTMRAMIVGETDYQDELVPGR